MTLLLENHLKRKLAEKYHQAQLRDCWIDTGGVNWNQNHAIQTKTG